MVAEFVRIPPVEKIEAARPSIQSHNLNSYEFSYKTSRVSSHCARLPNAVNRRLAIHPFNHLSH
jgi:hypothetical protein